MQKCEISSILAKFRFRENRPNIATSPDSFCFREKAIFSGYLAHFLLSYTYFRKNAGKTNSSAKTFVKTKIVAKIFTKICHTLVSSKYFLKNSPFSHVDIKYSLFCKKLNENSTIVNFREIFSQISRKF
jgi:hypothetical protein